MGIALIFVGMVFILLTLFFQKRRMDATDKINAIYMESMREALYSHDRSKEALWKDNESLWAELSDIKNNLIANRKIGENRESKE